MSDRRLPSVIIDGRRRRPVRYSKELLDRQSNLPPALPPIKPSRGGWCDPSGTDVHEMPPVSHHGCSRTRLLEQPKRIRTPAGFRLDLRSSSSTCVRKYWDGPFVFGFGRAGSMAQCRCSLPSRSCQSSFPGAPYSE